ncbi:DTW domain-containing protein 2 [Galdieria sulphuraria]|nr:DTW domain-containing protein 2 [Galdieria sulphuraria]
MSDNWSLPQVCEFPQRRKICDTCERPSKVCLCDVLPKDKLDHSTTVYILQHPAEAYAAFRTTPILQSCLRNVEVVKSRKLPPEWNELREEDLVLFPSDSAIPVRSVSRGQHRLFVIDATWSSAKSLYQKNDYFRERRNVTVSQTNTQSAIPSIPLFLLRKPPTSIANAYCTAEAVAAALYWLEQDEANGIKIYHSIRNCIRHFCEKQMLYISKDSLRHRRQNEGYIAGLYEQWQTTYKQE